MFENNVLLTQTERLMMSSRPKHPKYARNKNVLVIGGSGSGKTRFFVKPNLMQMHSSYVVTDPKGTVLIECGKLLQRGGYKIKVLNTINFKKSMRYNPFAYLRSEKDILKLVNTIIANTKGDGEKSGEDFWVKSERLFYCALIGYIWYEAPENEKNFTTLLEMINASEAREDDPEFQSPVDLMFERLEEKDPEHFAVRQYKKFLLSAGKTRSSILISCGARLAPFDIRELRELMETDEMELDTLGDRKTALFVIISDTDDTFNFVVSILYTQLFNLLCDKADDVYGGRLPVHVRCLLDEFANIGQIPKFEKLIATIRSREISASIILQSQSQLKAIYKDNADTIVGNCDTTLFLGGKEKTTLKEMSEILGKETIDSFNTSETRGRELSHGLNYQKLGKQLMSEDEIAVMDGGKCILQLRGVRPFFSEKYDITKHPKYKYLSDFDKKNAFDMEKHLRRRPAIVKPDEVFDYYEVDEADLQEDIGQLIDFTYNEDFFVHIPEVHNPRELGDYYLNKSGMVQMPAEWKNSIDLIAFGRNAAAQEKGSFTEYGYLVESGDAWEKHFEGRDVPEDYRIMSYPQPTVELDAAPAVQAAVPEATPQELRPVIPIVLTSEKPAEKLKEITDRLEQGITELFDSERYKEYLRVMSKFHNYSFNNTLLIAMQKPDASLIAGFSAWKNNFGRNVMKGQKGIKILAPSPFKIKKEMEKIDPQTQKAIIGKDGKPVTEEKEITIPAFKVVSVFDVSQTEGREIPDIAVNMLTGDVEHYKDVFAALEKTSPVPVGFEKIEGGAHGYYHLEDKRIALDEGMSELQTLKTLIHEIAHAKLHDIDLNAPLEDLENRPDRRTREVQAESIAYTVCQHYGLDTSDYSFGYVAGWSAGRELAELKSSLETIRSTAAEIINSIDEHIAELQKEQAQDAPREKAAMPEYIYKIEANPRTTGDNDRFFLQAYLPQENGRAKIGDVLYIGSLAKCRELMGGLNAGELTQGEVKELYAKAQEAEADKDTFSIYQLKQGDETRDFRFEPYDRLQAAGNVVDKANYELVYSAELTPGTSLEDIYTRFNIDHPKDFKGHSLSVSDVVVLHQNGQDAAHYVDSFGYKEVPEFLQEQTQQPEKINPLKHVEDTIEQNDNNFDGIINNTPTVDELEAKVKAGEQISLVDLAEAIKADKERGKEKPSIRAQLKADKERTGKKKNAKQKSQDLERS